MNLDRVFTYLGLINKHHLLTIEIFVNTELLKHANIPADTLEMIYEKTLAGSMQNEKQDIVKKLPNAGINS